MAEISDSDLARLARPLIRPYDGDAGPFLPLKAALRRGNMFGMTGGAGVIPNSFTVRNPASLSSSKN